MFVKTRKFVDFLEDNGLNLFDIQSENDLDILRHTEVSNGVSIQTVIFIEDNACAEVMYIFAQCPNVVKREQMQELLNKLNDDRKLKYYIRDDGTIIASFIYWATEENFDSRTLFSLYISFMNSIMENDLNRIMRIIWR